MLLTEKELFEKAIKDFGAEKQEEMAIEEMAELIQAVCHKHRGRKSNIAEEIADVEIMIEQLKIINRIPIYEIEGIKSEKLIRLAERLNLRNVTILKNTEVGNDS